MPRSSLRTATLVELLALAAPAARTDDGAALRSDSDSDGLDGVPVPLLNRRTDDGGRIPQYSRVNSGGGAARPSAAPTEVRPSDGSPSLAMLRRWQSYTSESSSSDEEAEDREHRLAVSARKPAARARPPAAETHLGGDAHPLPAALHPVAGKAASRRLPKPAAQGKASDPFLMASLDSALLEFLTATAADEQPGTASGETWRNEASMPPELRDSWEEAPGIMGSGGSSRTAQLVSTLGEMYGTMAQAGQFRSEGVDVSALPAQLQSVRVAQQFAVWAEQQKQMDLFRFHAS